MSNNLFSDNAEIKRYSGLLLLTLLTTLFGEFLFQKFIGNNSLESMIGRVAIIFISLSVIQYYAIQSMVRFRPQYKDLLLIHGMLIFSVFVFWFGNITTLAFTEYFASKFPSLIGVTSQAMRFAVPFAFGGLLIAAVKGLNYGLVFGICFSIIVGFYLPNDPLIIPYVLLTNLIACLSLSDLRSRSTYLRAALKIGIIAVPFSIVAVIHQDSVSAAEIFFRIVSPMVSGLLAVAIAAAFTPLLEQIGGYVTDLRLIEMSTLDHPLLKELSIQAPGTWNHSMVVGMMVEAAADEVGANKVLSRVGAYFHDIGKSKKPIYFVENQKGNENRHDRLSPSMSSLIIRAHVKDGVEMAKEHRLPQAIIDLIQQHHGTSMIEYFYNKACKDAEEHGESTEVDRSLYSYSGPKPQTREAGILMLADVIESSSRTLTEFSVDRIQMHVQKMINKIFASGQLDETDLTLRDLHKVARCFTRTLNGIYHQRISYDEHDDKHPGKNDKNEKSLEDNKQKRNSEKITQHRDKEVEGDSAKKAPNDQTEKTTTPENPHENLKRLGLEEYT